MSDSNCPHCGAEVSSVQEFPSSISLQCGSWFDSTGKHHQKPGCQIAQLEAEVSRLKNGLQSISDLRNATQERGTFCDIGVPEHLVDSEGFVPISPSTKSGVMWAANMAQDILNPQETPDDCT